MHIFFLYGTVFKITALFLNEELKRYFSSWMGWTFFSAPYATVGFAELAYFLLLDRPCLSPLPCGFTGRTAFKWPHVPTVAALSKPWKTGFCFHNWHRQCLGQEPNINDRDWPPPRDLEKRVDNAVGKLFPPINWHLNNVQVLRTFFMLPNQV